MGGEILPISRAAATLPLADQQRAATLVEIGLDQRDGLQNAQPGAPEPKRRRPA
jgi:hypothetical protein